MGDILTEKGPPRLDCGLVSSIAGIAEATGCSDGAQERLVGCERRQIEHSPVTSRGIERRVDAVRC
jgi:hypothetical protein